MTCFKFDKKLSFFAGLGVIMLLSLGTWQVNRLEWKQGVLIDITEGMANQPIDWYEKPDHLKIDYRSFYLEGHFLKKKSVRLVPRVYNGKQGYHLLSAFETVSGDVFLINRGFVAHDYQGRLEDDGQKNIRIVVVAKRPEKGNIFTPKNNKESDTVFRVDFKDMERVWKVNIVIPYIFYITEKNTDQPPYGGQLRIDIPNNHFQYAVFWYTMAVILFIMFVIYSMRNSGKKHDRNGL